MIRGVELSAKDYPNFHTLGYGFGDGDTVLARLELDLAEVEEIARPHFAQVMVNNVYVSTNREAFDCYLDTKEFREKVKMFKADAKACVEAVMAAGGKVSLAHPIR